MSPYVARNVSPTRLSVFCTLLTFVTAGTNRGIAFGSFSVPYIQSGGATTSIFFVILAMSPSGECGVYDGSLLCWRAGRRPGSRSRCSGLLFPAVLELFRTRRGASRACRVPVRLRAQPAPCRRRLSSEIQWGNHRTRPTKRMLRRNARYTHAAAELHATSPG